MEHIGIDLGSRDSQVCIRNGAGEIVEEMRCQTDRLVALLARRARPESLPKKVRRTLLQDAEGLPAHLDRLLVALETLSEQIAGADAELKELAAEDARMRRLMTVPGVGPVTAARFVAAIDHVERFPNASSVASYLGLVPGEDTTGFRIKRKRLTRAGAPQV